jgi:GTP pyrophosphokinase
MEKIDRYKEIKGNAEVRKAFVELMEMCPRCKLSKNRKLLISAFNFAFEAHATMHRKTGEPYILHPIEVSKIVVKEIGLGVTSVICALLHDVVEDNEDITIEIIENKFGEKVAKIVDGLTKIPTVSSNNINQQAATFRKMLMSIPQDLRVILIKLADRLHNMRTLDGMSENRQMVKAGETLYVYAPLARRLGLNKIGRELEDLSFRYHLPQDYGKLMQLIDASKEKRDRIFETFKTRMSTVLELDKYVYEMKGVQKSLYATWHKMNEKNLSFEEIHNFQTIRLIFKPKPKTPERQQCYYIYSLVTDLFAARKGSLQDWVSDPKSNNFEALIVDVMIGDGNWREIQILSNRMAELAERGYSSEKQIGRDNEPSQRDKWIEGLKDQLLNLKNDDLDFLDDFKLSLYVSEIYVYTPAGQIVKLPRGSSVLDFAFHIHTKLGIHCIGAKVNKKLVNISHVLDSADQIEIIDSEFSKPDKEWLNFVVSPRAKDALKHYFRKEDKDMIQLGKTKLKEILSGSAAENFQINKLKLRNHFELKDDNLLFYKIGKGLITKKELEKAYKSDHNQGFFEKFFPDFLKPKFADEIDQRHPDFSPKKPFDAIEVLNDPDYYLANCCNPIPGDNAFAYKDEDHKIYIHQISCKNANKLNAEHGRSVAKVVWKPHKISKYPARVFLSGIDRKSIVHNITYIVSEQMNVNMKSIGMEGNRGIYEGHITLYVPNLEVLNALIKKLKLIEGMKEVRRESLE